MYPLGNAGLIPNLNCIFLAPLLAVDIGTVTPYGDRKSEFPVFRRNTGDPGNIFMLDLRHG